MALPPFIEIARTLEANEAAAMRDLSTEHAALADGVVTFAGVGSYFNKAVGFGWKREPTGDDIDRIALFFSSRGVEPRIEISSFASPALLRLVAERGFVLQEVENVLARAVGERDREPGAMLPQGVDIQRVDSSDDAAVREFATVATSGFVPEGAPIPEILIAASTRAAKLARCDSFVARIGTRIVGAAGCGTTAESTLLYGASVLPEFRRRGIQAALIAVRLARAVERGASYALIVSHPGIPTERNAARMGFVMTYVRLILVLRRPDLVPSP